MKFNNSIKYRVTPRNNFVINFCGDYQNKRVLDIGCSYGWFEKFALERGAKEVIGIEPNKEYFKGAIKEVPKAKFIEASAERLPFRKNSFDKVVILEVLEHVKKDVEEEVIKQINKVTKIKGELFLSTPNFSFFSCLLDPAWYFGHRHYKLEYITNLLTRNGFTVKKTQLYGGSWELIRMIPHYFFKWCFNMEDPLNLFLKNKIKDDYKKKGFAYIYVKAIKNE